jgi:hypothetical protein
VDAARKTRKGTVRARNAGNLRLAPITAALPRPKPISPPVIPPLTVALRTCQYSDSANLIGDVILLVMLRLFFFRENLHSVDVLVVVLKGWFEELRVLMILWSGANRCKEV